MHPVLAISGQCSSRQAWQSERRFSHPFSPHCSIHVPMFLQALSANALNSQRNSKCSRSATTALQKQKSASAPPPRQSDRQTAQTPAVQGKPLTAGSETLAAPSRLSTAGIAGPSITAPGAPATPAGPSTDLPPKPPSSSPGPDRPGTAGQAKVNPAAAGLQRSASRVFSQAASATPGRASAVDRRRTSSAGVGGLGTAAAAAVNSIRCSSTVGAAGRGTAREGDGGSGRTPTPDNAPRYSVMKRYAKQMRAGSRTAGMKTRLDRTERELEKHLKAIRCVPCCCRRTVNVTPLLQGTPSRVSTSGLDFGAPGLVPSALCATTRRHMPP